MAVSTNHGCLSLREPGEWSLHDRADYLVLGMIGPTVPSLTEALVENLLRGINKNMKTKSSEQEATELQSSNAANKKSSLFQRCGVFSWAFESVEEYLH